MADIIAHKLLELKKIKNWADVSTVWAFLQSFVSRSLKSLEPMAKPPDQRFAGILETASLAAIETATDVAVSNRIVLVAVVFAFLAEL